MASDRDTGGRLFNSTDVIKGLGMKILIPALRQYRHNKNDGFVFGYDIAETEKIVTSMQDKNKSLEKIIEYLMSKISGLNNIILECTNDGELDVDLFNNYIEYFISKGEK